MHAFRGFVFAVLFVAVGSAQGQATCNIDAPASATTIDMIGWAFPITEFYAEELRTCNEVTNLRVNTQLLSSGAAREQVRLALSGGGTSPYEIIHADDAFVVELASEGWIRPLDEFIEMYREEFDLDDFTESLFAAATIDGQIYGIPIVSNTMHLFYRMDLLEQYGLDVPDTYDDVIAACGVLAQDPTIDLPFTINLHAGWAWRGEFHNFLIPLGGQWLNDDSSPAFNSPEGVAAVEKMLEVVDACMGQEGLSYTIDDTEIGLETGRLAMAVTWASRAANMDNPEISMFVGGIGFAPAPRLVADGPHAGPAATDFYVIPANTDVDPALIFRVIMEATDLESQQRASALGIVSRTSVVGGEGGARYFPAALATISGGAGNYGANPAVTLARLAVENQLPRVATGAVSAQEALDAAAAEYIREATAQGFLNP